MLSYYAVEATPERKSLSQKRSGFLADQRLPVRAHVFPLSGLARIDALVRNGIKCQVDVRAECGFQRQFSSVVVRFHGPRPQDVDKNAFGHLAGW